MSELFKSLKAGKSKGLDFSEIKEVIPYNFDFNDLKYRELKSSDALFNERHFRDYWKSRQKHKPSSQPDYQIGWIPDITGDDEPEKIAYFKDDKGNFHLAGFNQHYITDYGEGEEYYKSRYYKNDPAERKKYGRSYEEYFRDKAEYQQNFLNQDKFTKKQDKAKTKPVFSLLNWFKLNLGGTFTNLEVDFQYTLANRLFDWIKDAFFAAEVNDKKRKFVKTKCGLAPYYKKFINENFVKIEFDEDDINNMFKDIVANNNTVVLPLLRRITEANGYQLNVDETNKIYEKRIMQLYNVTHERPKILDTVRHEFEDKYGIRQDNSNAGKYTYKYNPMDLEQ